MNRLYRGCSLLLTLAVITPCTTARAEEEVVKRPYRFVVDSDRRGQVDGVIVVDGKSRLVRAESLPFEFECERAAVVSGYFEPIQKGQDLSLRVFDPEYKRGRKVSLSVKGFPHFRFAWGQPGTAPRCVDDGSPERTGCRPACPRRKSCGSNWNACFRARQTEDILFARYNP